MSERELTPEQLENSLGVFYKFLQRGKIVEMGFERLTTHGPDPDNPHSFRSVPTKYITVSMLIREN